MNKRLSIALTLYLTSLFASNTLGVKLMPFLLGTHLSTSIFVFPIVFLMTDVVGEIYGKTMSRLFVRLGLYSTAIFLVFNIISNRMPAAAEFTMNPAYNQMYGLSLRFALASMVAFVIGEYQDVFSFFFLKKILKGKWFGLRSTLSNVWSQLLDSIIWFGIAYTGVFPLKTIVLTLIPWWLFKVSMGVLYTPLSYLGLHLLRDNNDHQRI